MLLPLALLCSHFRGGARFAPTPFSWAHFTGIRAIQNSHALHYLGEKGMEASTVLEVSTAGNKPLYTIKVEGVDGRALNDELFVVARAIAAEKDALVFTILTAAPDANYRIPLL